MREKRKGVDSLKLCAFLENKNFCIYLLRVIADQGSPEMNKAGTLISNLKSPLRILAGNINPLDEETTCRSVVRTMHPETSHSRSHSTPRPRGEGKNGVLKASRELKLPKRGCLAHCSHRDPAPARNVMPGREGSSEEIPRPPLLPPSALISCGAALTLSLTRCQGQRRWRYPWLSAPEAQSREDKETGMEVNYNREEPGNPGMRPSSSSNKPLPTRS